MTTHPSVPVLRDSHRTGTIRSLLSAALVGALSLGAVGLGVPASAAVSPDAPVVINEVYGGGGNNGATLTHDFVELVNVSDAPAALTGWTLQYASATGAFSQQFPLTGTIPARGHFLVQLAAGDGGTTPLPTPDATGSLALGGTAGKVALASDTTAVSGPDAANVVDYVAWGSNATPAAGTPAPGATNTTSVSRDTAHTNTAVNGADFTAGTPTPRNSQGAAEPAPGPTPEPTPTEPAPEPTPTDPAVVTIAGIQGTGPSSPLGGQTVTTEGVVTAHYPTGGFNGYVIQTPGTGGALDLATHTASTAVFVFAPQAVSEVALGQTVRVTGVVGEFNGLTELTVGPSDAQVIADAAEPVPATVGWPTDDGQREALESMLVQPQGAFTVTNTFTTNQYGEVGLAAGDEPLRQPTDAATPGSGEAAAVAADNAARAVTLDDGASTNFLSAANSGLTPPYVSLTEPVVVGGAARFAAPVIVDWRNGAWKLNPTRALVGDGSGGDDGVEFSNPRTAAPAGVGGAVSVASFNVLNYFTTLGDSDPSCEPFVDRTGNGNNVDEGCLQRGAWDAADLERQQDKIVSAITTLDASVVGLMEIENSAALGETPDEATASLVDALNDAAGAGTWDYVRSSEELPPVTEQDLITNAIIYQPALVEPVGPSRALGALSDGDEAFSNAREPIGQVFESLAGGDPFLFVVNHFKSKGSAGPLPGDEDSGDGQGASNASRVAQATALRDWVTDIQGDTASVILAGDFNSYGQEDPLQVLYAGGYADAEAAFELGESSYSFQGLSGSLDHVLLNEAALARATGADIWNINSGESVALEYSRHNNHGALFHEPGPHRSSDHDPVKVGLTAEEAPVEIDILTINDFHGRLEANPSGDEAGAAVIAGAVKAHEAENPNTLFVSAGDNIGASTFTSLIQDDNPTIDTLVASGLDVSAVGNHEFDRGLDDLVNRVIPRFGGNPDPANVTAEQRALGEAYGLGANVYAKGTADPVLPEYVIKEQDGVGVAFIGTVTPDTATMVDPAGVATIEFGDQVEAANRVAAELAARDDVDVIVLLTHSGAATSGDCAALAADQAGFGALATGASAEIDAIVSAHTHQTYACDVPVDGAAGQTRPVIQAAEYGKAMGKLDIAYDRVRDELVSIDGSTFPLKGAYPADVDIQATVDAYVAEADVRGAVPVGEISGDILRGGAKPGDDRGVESSMGNWVADVYLWATSDNPQFAGTPAQIALMNPGGLRADLLRGEDGIVTYKEAALVQPFANTLVTVTLTGAQIQEILQQQWKATGDRPKLHLGVSDGFSYEYVEDAPPPGQAAPRSGRVVSMSYQGEAIAPTDTFTVVTNSFLANGGDGFATFAEGTDRTDTGQVDLDATLAYFEEFDVVDPAPLGRAILSLVGNPGQNPGTPPTPVDPGVTPPAAGQQTGGEWADVTLSNGGRVELGGVLRVTVSDLDPGQQIAATLFSDPIIVTGIPAADASGVTSFSIAIPVDFDLGAHRLVITAAGLDPIQVGVTVLRSGTLAVTGAELPWGVALAGGFLLVAGGLAFVLRRRTAASR